MSSTKVEMTPDNMRAQLRIINAELARVNAERQATADLVRSLETLLQYAREKPGPAIHWIELNAT